MTSLATHWQSQFVERYGFLPLLGMKEAGQFKKFESDMGELAYDVLDYALNNWPKFADFAGECGISVPPLYPHIGFLLSYQLFALALYWEALEKTKAPPILAKVTNSPPPITNSPPPIKEIEKPYRPTWAEIQATIDSLK